MNSRKGLFLTLFFTAFLLTQKSFGFDLSWVKCTGGSQDDNTSSVIVDSLGNTYSTGNFRGTVDFDPGPATFNLSSSGQTDVFILKLDSSGNFVWAAKIGGSSDESGLDLLKDNSGNIYVTGSFLSMILDLDPGAGSYTINNLNGNDAGFIVKLSNSGNFVWGRKYIEGNSSSWIIPAALAMDSAGDILFTGKYFGSVDFSGGVASAYTLNTTLLSFFVVKISPAGNMIWAVGNDGSPNYLNVFDVATDKFNNIYICGNYSMQTDFDPSAGTAYEPYSTTSDGFIVKLSSIGLFSWIKTVQNSTEFRSLVTDAAGNLYALGNYFDTIDADPGPQVLQMNTSGVKMGLILNLSNSGNLNWAKTMGTGGGIDLRCIRMNSVEEIYLYGRISAAYPTDLDPGPGNYTTLVFPNLGMVLIKLNHQGYFLGSVTLSGPTIESNEIAVSRTNAVYGIGREAYTGSLYFDPGHTLFTFTQHGNYDGIEFKIAPSLLPETPQLTAFPSSVCTGDSSTIYADGSLNGGTQWYLYEGSCGGTLLGSSALGIFTVYPLVNTTYFIRGEGILSGNGSCSQITISAINTPPPSSNANLAACMIDSMRVYNLPVSGTGIIWYDALTGGNVIPSTVLLVDSIVYYASQTLNGCESSVRVPDTAFISDPPAPVASSTQYFCWNSGSTISSLQATGNLIQWYATATSTNALNPGIPVVDNTIYYATQTVNGCESALRSPVLVEAPYLHDSLAATTCYGSSFQFPDGNTLSNLTTDTVYVSHLVSNAGCDSIVFTNLQVIHANAAIQQNAGTLTCTGTATSYQWLDCNNNMSVIAGETSQNFTPSQNGNYAVVAELNGCLDTSMCFPFLFLGFSSADNMLSFSVYLDPGSSTLYCHVPSSSDKNEVFLFDLTGRKIGEWTVGKEVSFKVYLASIDRGNYIITVVSDGVFYRQVITVP